MATIDEQIAEDIGSGIDSRIQRLTEERLRMLPDAAAARVKDIDSLLEKLQAEKTRIDMRRPKKPPEDITVGLGRDPIAQQTPTRVR